jgi:Hus1-like protein.
MLTKSELTASLSSLGKVCWMRLEYEVIRFTIIPDQGTQGCGHQYQSYA